jgi:hypothetical protein
MSESSKDKPRRRNREAVISVFSSLFRTLWNRILAIVFIHFLKSLWLVFVSSLSIVSILGSFILVTFQALWWPWLGTPDFLLPAKITVVIGYASIVIHLIGRIVRIHNIEDVLFVSSELGLVFGSLYYFRQVISAFFAKSVPVILDEKILTLEVKLVASLALVLLIIFLVLATTSIVMALSFRKLLDKVIISVSTRISSRGRSKTEKQNEG